MLLKIYLSQKGLASLYKWDIYKVGFLTLSPIENQQRNVPGWLIPSNVNVSAKNSVTVYKLYLGEG